MHIGLAMAAALKGYRVICTAPDKIPKEKVARAREAASDEAAIQNLVSGPGSVFEEVNLSRTNPTTGIEPSEPLSLKKCVTLRESVCVGVDVSAAGATITSLDAWAALQISAALKAST